MEESHRDLLQAHMSDLVKDLDPDRLYHYLVEDGIIMLDDRERIKNLINQGCTRSDQATELIDLITRGGPKAFDAFLRCLQPTYPHFYDMLAIGAGITQGVYEGQFAYIELLGSLQSAFLRSVFRVSIALPGQASLHTSIALDPGGRAGFGFNLR